MNRINEKVTAKRWAKKNGFHGAGGGWIYPDNGKRPVTQGWSHFFYLKRAAIWNSMWAGTLKPTMEKKEG